MYSRCCPKKPRSEIWINGYISIRWGNLCWTKVQHQTSGKEISLKVKRITLNVTKVFELTQIEKTILIAELSHLIYYFPAVRKRSKVPPVILGFIRYMIFNLSVFDPGPFFFTKSLLNSGIYIILFWLKLNDVENEITIKKTLIKED